MRSNNRLRSIGQRCKEERNNDTATHANYLVQSLPNGRAGEVAALGKLKKNGRLYESNKNIYSCLKFTSLVAVMDRGRQL